LDQSAVDGRRVVLVVGDADDGGARAVAQAVARARPDRDVRWVPGPTWARVRWTHRVSATGIVRTRLTLPGPGRAPLRDEDVAAVWYRASARPPHALAAAAPADQDYAAAELQALVVSWLAGLGDRVVNAVSGDGPGGPPLPAARWRVEAAAVGLPVTRAVAATSQRLVPGWSGSPWDARRPGESSAGPGSRVLVAGDRVVGARSTALAAGYRALAAAGGCRVLAVTVDADGGVCDADPVGALTSPDEVDAVARLLREVA